MTLAMLDEAALLGAVLERDTSAWREFVRRHDPPLREMVRHAAAEWPMTSGEIDDVLSNLWVHLIEDDFHRLRTFHAADGAPLLAWLTFHVTNIAYEHLRQRGREPTFDPIDPARASRKRIGGRGTLMRVEEVAARWDLNVKTIYGMIERGELPARRCGRVIRVPRSVVESFEQASVAPERRKPCR